MPAGNCRLLVQTATQRSQPLHFPKSMTITQRGIIVRNRAQTGHDAGDYGSLRKIRLRASWHSLTVFCAAGLVATSTKASWFISENGSTEDDCLKQSSC